MKKIFLGLGIVVFFGLGVAAGGLWFFGPPSNDNKTEVFVVPQKSEGFDFAEELYTQGFIKNIAVFGYFGVKELPTGGYRLRKNMWVWEVANKLKGKPDLVWVTFSACIRKEQIGEILAEALGWKSEDLAKWGKTEEGQYYPDTYLIPRDEPVNLVEKRLVDRFNEKFAPLADAYLAANIKWTTGVKIASLIAREAAGRQDMRLVSGIIWNRLNTEMLLQIDATMQYTYGKISPSTGSGQTAVWWGRIDLKEKLRDSPYNTYLYKGLPPTAICSPNIDYIEAALNPEETDCLYYLHDKNQQIHCAETYKEHLSNIKKYL